MNTADLSKMTRAKADCFRANRVRNIAAGMYEIDYRSCEGFWFVRIDGRSFAIGHDDTTDAEMTVRAREWIAKYAT